MSFNFDLNEIMLEKGIRVGSASTRMFPRIPVIKEAMVDSSSNTNSNM